MSKAASIFWIGGLAVGRLGIVPRPRGDDWLTDEIASIALAGVDIVVSCLEQSEARELGLCDEQRLCRAAGVEFISFPIPDRGTPESSREMVKFARQLLDRLRESRSIAIHCRQSVGRSALVAATVLVTAGIPAEQAFVSIALARGCPVPDTEEQRAWVARLERKQPAGIGWKPM